MKIVIHLDLRIPLPPIALLMPNFCISTPCYQTQTTRESWLRPQKRKIRTTMAAGSGEVVVANTNLRLYSYWKSSCSFRVRIALNLKGIKYEYKAANLLKGVRSDHEFLKFNPLGYVPVLVDGDAVVADSLAIVMYLEDKYPQQHPLLPHDIHKRAINFQVAHIVSSAIQPFQGRSILVNYIEEKVSPEEKLACTKNAIYKGFRALERLLKEHAGKYATGDEVLLADLFLAPQIHAAVTRFGIDKKEFPILAGLYETYREIPAFREALPENQPDAVH